MIKSDSNPLNPKTGFSFIEINSFAFSSPLIPPYQLSFSEESKSLLLNDDKILNSSEDNDIISDNEKENWSEIQSVSSINNYEKRDNLITEKIIECINILTQKKKNFYLC